MRTRLFAPLLALLSACSGIFEKDVPMSSETASKSFYSLKASTLAGESVELAQWKGQVALVVNTASECGFTPQYEGLEALHTKYAPRGFTVLGFPSNDFGGQEPGTAQEIQAFCTSKFHVDFPLFEKVVTKPGAQQSPVYAFLGAASGKLPNWNFGKYLIARDGKVLGFWPSTTKPDDKELVKAIEAALDAK
ncbi:MAG: glutathione peroxidase [Planctomycetota bacterium]